MKDGILFLRDTVVSPVTGSLAGSGLLLRWFNKKANTWQHCTEGIEQPRTMHDASSFASKASARANLARLIKSFSFLVAAPRGICDKAV